MRRFGKIARASTLAATVALMGCAMPRHQDAVFFGTDTKVAFDVGVQPENGNTPSVTLGYKRREFVYMPLAEYGPAPNTGIVEGLLAGDAFRSKSENKTTAVSANSDNVRLASANASLSGLLAGANADGSTIDNNPSGKRHKYKAGGENANQKDSYSVFATFGGNFDGGGNGASARIKQVFATGIAARIAAKNGADYVNPEAAAAKVDAANAKARAAVAEARFGASGVETKDCLRTAILALPDDLAISKATALPTQLVDNRGASATTNINVPADINGSPNTARRYLRDYMWASDPAKYSDWNVDLGASCIK